MRVVSNGGELRLSLATARGELEILAANHFELVRALLQRYEHAYLVSPFLFLDFAPLFSGIDLTDKRIDLVTSCSPRGNDLLTKPFSMQSFGRIIQQQTGRWPAIHIDQALHSKVYIFYEDERPAVGIVTSANLTHGGLQNNSETGIVVMDEATLRDIRRAVERDIDYVHITEQQVDLLCQVVGSVGPGYPRGEDIDMGVPNILARNCAPSAGNTSLKLSPNAKFFIKVSGVSDDPIRVEDKEPFDAPHPDLSFAKEPASISHGDALIEVAVGARCFLTYYACSSGASMRTAEEQARSPHHARWKFYMYGNNLAPAFGAHWFENPLFYDDVIAQFKARYPDNPVTAAGANHIQPAINYGHSFLEITKEFGQFVKDLIDGRARNLSGAASAAATRKTAKKTAIDQDGASA